MTTRMIGARIPRNEDPRLLRGLGCFVDDVHLEGMLHAAGLRSPHGHARIVSIDAARARALPGVHLVLTAADLGELNQPSPLLIPHPGPHRSPAPSGRSPPTASATWARWSRSWSRRTATSPRTPRS